MASAIGIFAGTVFTSFAATVSQALPSSATWISVILNVTEVTGTDPSVVFSIQWSIDGGTWADGGDYFPPITEPTCVVQRFQGKAPYWRCVVEVSGTDSPTFTGTANGYVA